MLDHQFHRQGMSVMIALFVVSTAVTQTSLTFVKDINTSHISSPSNPHPRRSYTSQTRNKWAVMGGWFYFQARTEDHGYELYKSDGTKAVLVKDINKGRGNSSPNYFEAVGNKVYFQATTANRGSELWVTDGTEAGTTLVKDLRAGSGSSNPHNLARIGAKICFAADDGRRGTEMWISDGTASGTTLLKDISAGRSSSYPSYNRSNATSTKVFFSANDNKNGRELWVTDGTTAGTVLVKNILAGFSSSSPRYFQHLGPNKVAFQAYGSKYGIELWVSDGTAAGTAMVRDVNPGTLGGANLSPGTSLGTKVLFLGRSKAAGYEPWITDGTAAGTMLLKDIRPGTDSSFMSSSTFDSGKAWWGAYSGSGYEIWVTDGTSAGTRRFSKASVSREPAIYIAATNGMVFFQGQDVTAGTGREICMTNGVTTTTVKDIRPGSSHGYAHFCSVVGKGVVAFSADDGKAGRELWVSKGSSTTTMLIDINKPSGRIPTGNDMVSYIEPLFGKLVFSATDGNDKTKGQRGQEIWISDGTATGTRLLKDINVGTSTTFASSSFPRYTCRLGNYVYFSANDGIKGAELWRTDGTPAGTGLFMDIRSGKPGSSPGALTRIGDKIYFRANNGTTGYELWVTDGTLAGTSLVKDINPGSRSSYPAHFAALGLGDKCLFQATVSGQGYELWVSDGTSLGTKLVKDIYPGSRSSEPSFMRSFGDKVFFQAFTPAAGYELWSSDGTSSGTAMVKDILPGSGSGYARQIELQNQRLYFYSYSTTAGFEMHRSDGTAAGTALYWDLNPGRRNTNPGHMTAVGSRRLYFRGDYTSRSKAYGVEPLYFDVMTKAFVNFDANLSGSSNPFNSAGGTYRFAVDGGSVYMSATPTYYIDYQLCRIENGATAQSIGRIQSSSLMTATDPRLGQSMALSGKTALGKAVTLVLMGFEDATPRGLASLAPKSYTYLDLSRPFFFVGGPMTGATWTLSAPVPAKTSLLGARAVLQAWSLDIKTFPQGVEVSNGIHITIGR